MRIKLGITGANGFVGNHITDSFSKDTFEITSINLRGDWGKIDFNCFDAVIHLAGIAHDLKGNYTKNDYFNVNYNLTKSVFEKFSKSECSTFIYLSSIKVYPNNQKLLTEKVSPLPDSYYGISKLKAEEYISNFKISNNKNVYTLRPSMIYGPNNKGNIISLYKFLTKGYPWPFGSFNSDRSYCSINNLLFVIKELITRNNIKSGVYNVCDDKSFKMNEIINQIKLSKPRRKIIVLKIDKRLIKLFAKIGDKVNLKFNSIILSKITSDLIVSNRKILESLKINEMPFDTKNEFRKTFDSYN